MTARGYIAAFLALAALAGAPTAAAEPVAVIVNKANPVDAMSEDDIMRAYTNKVLRWPDGSPMIIYDLAIQNPLRELFSVRVLGKRPDKVADEWAHLKITNQAKNPPNTVKSESLIIRRVSTERGAIGYVSLGLVKGSGSVKIVNILQ